MPRKNYSELIKDKSKRTLTAKGHKFVVQCIKVVAKNRGYSSMYAGELKPVKEKLRKIIPHLIIDKELSIPEIKDMIAKSTKSSLENHTI